MAKKAFKINTGKWGKATSLRIGQRGKGNVNISKKGVRYNPGCGCLIFIFAGFGVSAIGILASI